ncbi:MAG: hypothetical protein II179_03265 [Alphaproteobacteria bacterium]|nr:hypothetical protein [Alphaproteobacteria bacterium]
MRKFGFSATLLGFCFGASRVASAAYPAYPSPQVPLYQQQYQQQMQAQAAYPVQPGTVQLPTANGTVLVANSGVAVPATRVTGALPKVGSAATAAGRKYYLPSDYDRLADSGLYVGFSVAYAASVMGSIKADYMGETGGFAAPGAFAAADFQTDTVIPLQFSVGSALNNDIRVDFSYTRYSGLSYPDHVETAEDSSGKTHQASVEGGAITANTTMLNIYYNLDTYTGYLAGGSLRPYIGVGVGLSLNTIADYVVRDDWYYAIIEHLSSTEGKAGLLTGVSDIYAYHNGGTNEQLAFMVEGGITTDLGGGIKLDLFARYANLGNVKTSGSIVVSQIEWLSTGTGLEDGSGEVQADYDSVFHYTNWYESGRLSLIDVGARLRLQF